VNRRISKSATHHSSLARLLSAFSIPIRTRVPKAGILGRVHPIGPFMLRSAYRA
jgi:hypothetical protein